MNKSDKAQFMTVEIFILRHKDKRHCDAIINREGLVAYTIPSHQKVLMDLAGPEVLRSGIQNQQQLVDATGTILVSTDGYYPNKIPSVPQIKALNKLIKAGLVGAKQIDVY